MTAKSMPTVHLLDYVAGNIRSLVNAIEKCGWEVEWIRSPEDVAKADVSVPSVFLRALLSTSFADALEETGKSPSRQSEVRRALWFLERPLTCITTKSLVSPSFDIWHVRASLRRCWLDRFLHSYVLMPQALSLDL